VLDLGPPVREQLLLFVPELALCDEACQGFCPGCGSDRNQTTCECVGEAGPNPWDALKKLQFE
jgi:uncharacterized protein